MISKSQTQANGHTQVQTMIITAISLFALSGLMVGFAFGAFVRPQHPTQATNQQHNSKAVVHTTPTPTATPSIQPRALGFPMVSAVTGQEIADGKTTYTVAAYPVDQSQSKTSGVQIHTNTITCKIWLTKDTNGSDITNQLEQNHSAQLKDINAIAQPLPTEDAGALTFASTTPQTQPCNASGNTTWNYTVPPSTDAGSYYLVVFVDWQGQYYNWVFEAISIQKAD